MSRELNETIDFLKTFSISVPQIGIIMGTGLHQISSSINIHQAISYQDIPHFPVSTVESHKGNLLFGTINDVPVIAMQGRFHFYEGYSMQEVTFPIRVMKLLGIHTLLVSNAAGALRPGFKKGDLMLIEDHINLQGSNPLIGPNDENLGPRFPDMSAPYDAGLRGKIKSIAAVLSIQLHEGVYVAVNGPMLETRAEYRYLKTIGADAVGMSTVPEIITARHMGIRCAAISVLTDECDPDHLQPVTLEEIIAVANAADVKLTKLITELIAAI